MLPVKSISGRGNTESTVKQKILALLRSSPGEYVSGGRISQVLGITRSAVWKHVEHLREEGYVIDSVPRKGYKIISAPDFLYPGEILKGLDTEVFGRELYHAQKVDSTNNWAKKMAEEGVPDGTIFLAEEQAAGRGRMDRPWKSPPGGIWMSVVLRPGIQPYLAPGLTLVAAVAAVGAIKAVTGLDPLIKWPNDIYIGDKKVCGILTEMKAEMDRVNYIVIGMGINANIDVSTLGNAALTAGSLSMFLGGPVDRKQLVRELLSQLEDYYFRFRKDGMAPILDVWRKNNFTLGRYIILKQGGEEFKGVAEDITPEGGLLLRDEQGGTKVFYSGEVTVGSHSGIRNGKK